METGRPTWRSRAWPVAGAALAVLALLLLSTGVGTPGGARVVLAVAAVVTASVVTWAVVRTRAQRRRFEEELAGWAADRAAHEERLRIARDLHDLVSHGLGVITVRAAAARSVTGPDGDAERALALTDVERTSRATTTELRRVLAVLRTPGHAPLRPAESLADLPAVVRAADDAGLRTDVVVGDLGPVSPRGAADGLRGRPRGAHQRAPARRSDERAGRGPARGCGGGGRRARRRAGAGLVAAAGGGARRRGPARAGRRARREPRARAGRRGPPADRPRARRGGHVTEGPADAPVRVVVVDDEALLRHSLALLVDGAPDLVTVGTAGTGSAAVRLVREVVPDVVLMDIRMPDGDGIAATRAVTSDPALARCRVLVLSMLELDEYVYGALRAGASGFLLKDAHPEQLLDAVRRTHAGESLFAPAILARLVEHFVSRPAAGRARPLDVLTPRETQVLELVGRGLSNDEIAGALTISVKTVKTHVGSLLAKLAARDRAQLVISAYENGLVG